MLNIFSLYLLYAAATVILAYRLIKLAKAKDLLIYSGFLITGIALFWYQHADIAALIAGVIIFNALISSYGKKVCYLFIVAAILYSSYVYFLSAQLLLEAIFLGMLSGSYITKEKSKAMRKNHILLRNAIQIAAGIAFIGILYLYGLGLLTVVMIAFLLLASLVANYALTANDSLSKALYSIEKEGTVLGSGARWLSVGAIVAVAFLQKDYAIVVLIAIFISDSLSTIVGQSLAGPKLPYNGKKTVSGTAAYFLSASILSYPFIGIAALPIGIIAALLESQPFHIDDNFDVALVTVILFLVLSYLGVMVR